MTQEERIIALEKRVETLETYIKDLQWNIEYKWGLDFMGENSAHMWNMIQGAYNR